MSEVGLPGYQDHETARLAAEEANDPAALLLADHAWLRLVIDELQPLSQQAGQFIQLRENVLELAPAIEAHIRQEEEAFFPAIEQIMRELGQGSTEDMLGEHDAIRIRIDELLKAFHTAADVGHAYANFARSLLVHFDNEEELIFEEAPKRLDWETRQQLLERFKPLQPES